MAVSTLDNGIKILANADGLRLLRTLENRSFDASRNAAETVTKVTPCNHNILRILSASMINQSLFMQPLINPLTAAANAAAASSSGTPAPAAITEIYVASTRFFLLKFDTVHYSKSCTYGDLM